MINIIQTSRFSFLRRFIAAVIVFFFSFNTFIPLSIAQQLTILPAPNMMVSVSPAFAPVVIKGIKIYPQDPLKFDFILDSGQSGLTGDALKEESQRLIKYFLASLTTPEDDLWVNLSPFEKDRIIPNQFGTTEMGRDMLAQDYLLKQLTASLIYPEKDLGKKFWDRVYKKAFEKYGTTEIAVNTFNKVWIVPERAVVEEIGDTAFVAESKLKVMIEEDYLAMSKKSEARNQKSDQANLTSDVGHLTSNIVRELIIPEIEKEINEGKNFALLRQIYNSLILAAWYKRALKESILGQIYVDQNKVEGVDLEDKQAKEKIYQQYLEAYKQGVYNYIKEDYDENTQQVLPRKYFSGGVQLGFEAKTEAQPGKVDIGPKLTVVKRAPSIWRAALDKLKRTFFGLSFLVGVSLVQPGILPAQETKPTSPESAIVQQDKESIQSLLDLLIKGNEEQQKKAAARYVKLTLDAIEGKIDIRKYTTVKLSGKEAESSEYFASNLLSSVAETSEKISKGSEHIRREIAAQNGPDILFDHLEGNKNLFFVLSSLWIDAPEDVQQRLVEKCLSERFLNSAVSSLVLRILNAAFGGESESEAKRITAFIVSQKGVDKLLNLLKRKEGNERHQVIEVLANMVIHWPDQTNTDVNVITSALEEALYTEDPAIRWEAYKALRKVVKSNPAQYEDLIKRADQKRERKQVLPNDRASKEIKLIVVDIFEDWNKGHGTAVLSQMVSTVLQRKINLGDEKVQADLIAEFGLDKSKKYAPRELAEKLLAKFNISLELVNASVNNTQTLREKINGYKDQTTIVSMSASDVNVQLQFWNQTYGFPEFLNGIIPLDLATKLEAREILFLFSAGNEGSFRFHTHPILDNVRAIGAAEKDERGWQKTDYSDYGPDVWMSASGLTLDGQRGTSFATPTVTGRVLLAASSNPQTPLKQILAELEDQAQPVQGNAWGYYGKGALELQESKKDEVAAKDKEVAKKVKDMLGVVRQFPGLIQSGAPGLAAMGKPALPFILDAFKKEQSSEMQELLADIILEIIVGLPLTAERNPDPIVSNEVIPVLQEILKSGHEGSQRSSIEILGKLAQLGGGLGYDAPLIRQDIGLFFVELAQGKAPWLQKVIVEEVKSKSEEWESISLKKGEVVEGKAEEKEEEKITKFDIKINSKITGDEEKQAPVDPAAAEAASKASLRRQALGALRDVLKFLPDNVIEQKAIPELLEFLKDKDLQVEIAQVILFHIAEAPYPKYNDILKQKVLPAFFEALKSSDSDWFHEFTIAGLSEITKSRPNVAQTDILPRLFEYVKANPYNRKHELEALGKIASNARAYSKIVTKEIVPYLIQFLKSNKTGEGIGVQPAMDALNALIWAIGADKDGSLGYDVKTVVDVADIIVAYLKATPAEPDMYLGDIRMVSPFQTTLNLFSRLMGRLPETYPQKRFWEMMSSQENLVTQRVVSLNNMLAINQNIDFVIVTESLGKAMQFSIARAIEGLFQRFDLPAADDKRISAWTAVIAEVIKKNGNRVIFDASTNLVAGNYGPDPIIDFKGQTDKLVEDLQKGLGLSKVTRFKDAQNDKAGILDAIENAPYGTTFYFYYHGGPKHFWMVGGALGTQISDELRDPRAISYLEWKEALVKRAKKNNGHLEKDNFVLNACFSGDCAINLEIALQEAVDSGEVKSLPFVITSSQGVVSHAGTVQEGISTKLKTGAKAITARDIWEAGDQKKPEYMIDDFITIVPIDDATHAEIVRIADVDPSQVKADSKKYIGTGKLAPSIHALSGLIGKKVKGRVAVKEDGRKVLQALNAEDPTNVLEEIEFTRNDTDILNTLRRLRMSSGEFSPILDEFLRLLETSPPEFYTFDRLVGDLLGLESAQNNLIAIHRSLHNAPIAIFHEIGEYLVRQGRLKLEFEPVGEEGEVVLMTKRGRQIGRIYIDKDALAIARKGTESPHYLLRAIQRAMFGDEDRQLTLDIKDIQGETQALADMDDAIAVVDEAGLGEEDTDVSVDAELIPSLQELANAQNRFHELFDSTVVRPMSRYRLDSMTRTDVASILEISTVDLEATADAARETVDRATTAIADLSDSPAMQRFFGLEQNKYKRHLSFLLDAMFIRMMRQLVMDGERRVDQDFLDRITLENMDPLLIAERVCEKILKAVADGIYLNEEGSVQIDDVKEWRGMYLRRMIQLLHPRAREIIRQFIDGIALTADTRLELEKTALALRKFIASDDIEPDERGYSETFLEQVQDVLGNDFGFLNETDSDAGVSVQQAQDIFRGVKNYKPREEPVTITVNDNGQDVVLQRFAHGDHNNIFKYKGWVLRIAKNKTAENLELVRQGRIGFKLASRTGIGPKVIVGGERQGYPYLVVEEIIGKTIDELIREGGDIFNITDQYILPLMDMLIASGIYTADFRHSNIMIGHKAGQTDDDNVAYFVDGEMLNEASDKTILQRAQDFFNEFQLARSEADKFDGEAILLIQQHLNKIINGEIQLPEIDRDTDDIDGPTDSDAGIDVGRTLYFQKEALWVSKDKGEGIGLLGKEERLMYAVVKAGQNDWDKATEALVKNISLDLIDAPPPEAPLLDLREIIAQYLDLKRNNPEKYSKIIAELRKRLFAQAVDKDLPFEDLDHYVGIYFGPNEDELLNIDSVARTLQLKEDTGILEKIAQGQEIHQAALLMPRDAAQKYLDIHQNYSAKLGVYAREFRQADNDDADDVEAMHKSSVGLLVYSTTEPDAEPLEEEVTIETARILLDKGILKIYLVNGEFRLVGERSEDTFDLTPQELERFFKEREIWGMVKYSNALMTDPNGNYVIYEILAEDALAQLAQGKLKGYLYKGEVQIVKKGPGPDSAVTDSDRGVGGDKSETRGGIDFNPADLNLQIRHDSKGMPVPFTPTELQNINIKGFTPLIINITPIPSLPMLLGESQEQNVPELSLRK